MMLGQGQIRKARRNGVCRPAKQPLRFGRTVCRSKMLSNGALSLNPMAPSILVRCSILCSMRRFWEYHENRRLRRRNDYCSLTLQWQRRVAIESGEDFFHGEHGNFTKGTEKNCYIFGVEQYNIRQTFTRLSVFKPRSFSSSERSPCSTYWSGIPSR